MNDRTRKTAGRSAFFRGEDGMRRTDEELAMQKQRSEERKAAGSMPFRFYVPVGETRRIIIVDDKPDFFMYEHSLKDKDGKWGRLFSGCVKTFDNCPVCKVAERESYYAMVLTCIDLTPFQLRDGTDVEFSRKLLIVKPAQQKKFLRFYNKEGTLYGAMFEMTRDGEKDSAIGNDIEFVEFVDEDELLTYHRSWKDKDGKKHSENCFEPYVYEDLFEEPDVEKLRALVGGEPTPGSRASDDRALGRRSTAGKKPRRGDDDWEEADDDAPFDGGTRRKDVDKAPPTRTGRRTAPRDVDEDEDEDEAPPPRSRRGARDAEKPPARASRRSAPEPDDEPPARTRRTREPVEEDEAPPPRRPRR